MKREYIIESCLREISQIYGFDLNIYDEQRMRRYISMILQIGSELKEETKPEINFENSFGNKLRNARLEAGLTQKALCEKMNNVVRANFISQYETGVRVPTIEVAKALFEALKIKKKNCKVNLLTDDDLNQYSNLYC